MTMTYSYEKMKKSVDLVFKKASLEGRVAIKKDDQIYILTSASKNISPLDVEGVDIKITSEDIVKCIHESRRK